MKADLKGRWGSFGGCYLPELLMTPIFHLKKEWERTQSDPVFTNELKNLLINYAGRETPLTEASHFVAELGGDFRLFLKREDLLHTGAHKINNALGQCLLAKHMGKTRVIAETGAGQHGVATATACARLGLSCVVYMGSIDLERQYPNVEKMRLLGAEVRSVSQGSMTLKDAINEALRDWSENYERSHYCLGSALGPDPYPTIVREFQSVIGKETKRQVLDQVGQLPDQVYACVGGGSNAIGIFSAFLNDSSVQLIGVEGGGRKIEIGQHAARFSGGSPGVFHGCYTYLLQDLNGQILSTHSVSAGLDYAAVGPEHSALHELGRVEYTYAKDQDVIEAMQLLAKTEGIIPALESSHALAEVIRRALQIPRGSIVVVNLSGRGDKDLPTLFERIGGKNE